ncbi:hypothetical protein BOTBODRAFT_465038 [Botryobasidium botryosum FD-172 SS1]|uniref:Zn(2)-C6 fungal-type domain-containing protein n=1 Tax=Botryobasidium botryosum (strain FD-172 SS1) TaxID=930990 RepID=A0A067M675_BOTB1|nr:hypothetical protein BOTBODRAFT_465038 [Botryobasidium botryosum FD-172 SS1]
MSMQQSLALRSSRVRRGDACTTCRRRKIKCDSGRPACNRCISSGSSLKCHYEIAPARSTTQWLQQRLEDLEESLALLESSTPVQSSKGRIPNIFSMPSRPHPYPIRTPGVVNLNSSSNATSLEVPMPLGDPLGEWWMDGELPVPVRDRLIRIFVSNRWQFSFEFSVSRLEASLRTLPPDHSDIHPAFLNAILLNACLYSRDSLRRLEPVFLARTRRALADSLGLATGLFDFLRASALLGMYYYWAGRNIEGHHYLSGTMRFALACGLHEITSLETATTGSLLSPARDLVEVGERINLFWMLYANDRAGSMLNRLPVAMPDKIIKTMYPYPLVYYETVVVYSAPLERLEALLTLIPSLEGRQERATSTSYCSTRR